MGGERLFAGRAFEAAGAGRGGRRKFEAIEIEFGADVVEVLEVKDALDGFHGSDRLLRSRAQRTRFGLCATFM